MSPALTFELEALIRSLVRVSQQECDEGALYADTHIVRVEVSVAHRWSWMARQSLCVPELVQTATQHGAFHHPQSAGLACVSTLIAGELVWKASLELIIIYAMLHRYTDLL